MVCIFCLRSVPTRGHGVVPRCKGGTEVVATYHSCEDFIHETWTHNEPAGRVQHGRENPGGSAFPKDSSLALQAAGRDVLSDPAQPSPNQPASPIVCSL